MLLSIRITNQAAGTQTRGCASSTLRPSGHNWAATILLSALLGLPVGADEPVAQHAEVAAEARHFTLKVLPLLKSRCLGCHGDGDELAGGYDLRTRNAMLAGGESESEPVLLHNAADSPLIHAVQWLDREMPPKENDRLTDDEVASITRWIDAGAPWPSAGEQQQIIAVERSVLENEDGRLVATSGGLSDSWTYRRYRPEDIWAFQPLRTEFSHNSIDGFVNARLSEADLQPAQPATPEELIRRVSYDLTGLPPTAAEVTTFARDWPSDPEAALSTLIDRLLASPHYGERWGQHWLDVARYADTAGFSNDYERSNAWRYRDYVIRAFNADKPYDEFIIEQIAGDELHPNDPEAIIATGFLRMGPWGTAMIPAEEARQLYRDDVVHSIGQTFLSMPMRCCKCHDHKFDPVPTRDYYRIYAALSATQPAEVPAEFLDVENQNGFGEGNALAEQLYAYANGKRQELEEKQEAAARKWYTERGLEYKDQRARKDDPDDEKPPRHCGLSETEKGKLKVREQDCWIWERRQERYQPLAHSVYNGEDTWMDAKHLRRPQESSDDNWLPVSYIHLGGDYQAKGEQVTPGVLSGCAVPLSDPPGDDPYRLTTDLEGRRLGLAEWIADPRNPLTARSFVNRVWQYHFGQGLSRTPNNFGVKGAKPTHPELLDWLTQRFIEGGWHIKPLHKTILMSDVYQRSTQHPELSSVEAVDPDNRLLARFLPRRLTAEELRDSMLVASGELNREIGGVPAMPEINMEVALQPRMIQFSIAPAYQPSRTPEQRNRRSIYAYRVRGQADPFMEVLNLPNPNDSCERRNSAAVSPQAFTLMNSSALSDRAIAMAVDLQASGGITEQIELAFRRALGRSPMGDEHRSMATYYEEMVDHHQAHLPKSIPYPTSVTRSLVEEFTGKTFEFEEVLPVFEDYVPDTKPDTVSPEVRAMADICLLLFNSHEFVYVY